MNWEQIQGKWREYKGQIKQRWGHLTDDDLKVIDGKRDVLAGKLLASYGNSKGGSRRRSPRSKRPAGPVARRSRWAKRRRARTRSDRLGPPGTVRPFPNPRPSYTRPMNRRSFLASVAGFALTSSMDVAVPAAPDRVSRRSCLRPAPTPSAPSRG